MTLGQFFEYLSSNSLVVVLFFLAVPLMALLINFMAHGEGHLSPWRYVYAVLIYLACVPGILSVALAIYQFLFEPGHSIYNMDLATQLLPVVSMITTLGIVRRNAPFDYIPGFGRLSTFMTLIVAVFILMYLLNRLRLIVWINLPVQYFIVVVVGLLLVLRFSLAKLIR